MKRNSILKLIDAFNLSFDMHTIQGDSKIMGKNLRGGAAQ